MLVTLPPLAVVVFPPIVTANGVILPVLITVCDGRGLITTARGTTSGIALLATSRFDEPGTIVVFAGGLVPVAGPGVIGGVGLGADNVSMLATVVLFVAETTLAVVSVTLIVFGADTDDRVAEVVG